MTGVKGSGKDMLFANVIARLPKGSRYASNIDYKVEAEYYPLDISALDCGKNTYKDFIENTPKHFDCPLPDGTPIFLSDAGIYLPSQYCNELNKAFPYLSTFFCLGRQLLDAPQHINVQSLNRLYDKLREHSDCYLLCRWCKVLPGGLVVQLVTEYDRYQSCLERVKPCAIKIGFLEPAETRTSKQLYIDGFENSHGLVRNHLLIYFNRSNYDTRHFKTYLGTTYPDERNQNEE